MNRRAVAIRMMQKGEVFCPPITNWYLSIPRKNTQTKMRTKHPSIFFFFFSFFFFSSSSPSPFGRWHSPTTPDPAVTHHLRPNHLWRCSSFPTKPNWKTQTQPQKLILIHQTLFLMPQNSILMPQKSFFDSKLKLRFWKLTLKGSGICQRRWTWVTPNPRLGLAGRDGWRSWVECRWPAMGRLCSAVPWVGCASFFLLLLSLLSLFFLL